MRVELLFVQARDFAVVVESWRLLDARLRLVDVHLPLTPIERIDELAWQEHVLAGQPVSRVDDDIADRQLFVVEDEVFDVADLTVARLDAMTEDVSDTAQVRVGGLFVGARRGFFFPF